MRVNTSDVLMGINGDYINNCTLNLNQIRASRTGISLRFAMSCSIENNTLTTNKEYDLDLYYSAQLRLRNNRLEGRGLRIDGDRDGFTSHDIDASNRYIGKSIQYLVNKTGLSMLNITAGSLVLFANCNDSVITGLAGAPNKTAMALYYCVNITFQDCMLGDSDTSTGFYSYKSRNITLASSNITGCMTGVHVETSSNFTIWNNTIDHNLNGLLLDECNDSVIDHNSIRDNNECGIYVGVKVRPSIEFYACYCRGSSVASSGSGTTGIDTSGYWLSQSLRNRIELNTITNAHVGIEVHYNAVNNTFFQNAMVNCSFLATGMQNLFNSSNTVNGRPVLFFTNENGLVPANFTAAGQVLLNACGNVTITGIEISQCTQGITLASCKNVSITSSNLTRCHFSGIGIRESDQVFLDGVTFLENGDASINLEWCGTVSLHDTTTISGNGDGLIADEVDQLVIRDSSFCSNAGRGVLVDTGSATISESEFSRNGENGIYFLHVFGASFVDNDVIHNGWTGIILDDSPGNILSQNRINNNGGFGIIIYSSDDNEVTYNTIQDNADGCVSLEYSDGNYLYGNTCNDPTFTGLTVFTWIGLALSLALFCTIAVILRRRRRSPTGTRTLNTITLKILLISAIFLPVAVFLSWLMLGSMWWPMSVLYDNYATFYNYSAFFALVPIVIMLISILLARKGSRPARSGNTKGSDEFNGKK
jgi:parallel beta-helix repeat protein